MPTRQDVVIAARAYIGTPWRHQGRSKEYGVDCIGLAICVARDIGSVSPDFDLNGYGRQPDGSMLRTAMRLMERRDGLASGMVIVFSISRDPQHIGILGDWLHGGLSLIHASSPLGGVVETRFMPARNLRVRGAFDMPGVA